MQHRESKGDFWHLGEWPPCPLKSPYNK